MKWRIGAILFLVLALVIFVFGYGWIEPRMQAFLQTGSTLFVQRTDIVQLFWEHVQLVGYTTSIAIIVGVGSAIVLQLPTGMYFRPIVSKLGALLQSFPTIAIIALLVPLVGYGNKAVIVGVALYGIFPLLQNTLTGFEQVDEAIIDAAKGMGMTEWQQIRKMKIPLALPIMLAGLRTTLIISMSAVTIGAAAGSGGLGVPIVLGLRAQNLVLILQGTIPIALLALASDQCLRVVEQLAHQRMGNG